MPPAAAVPVLCCYPLRMLNTRRLLGGMLALLLVSGVACKQSSSVQAPAQTEPAPTAPADVAVLRVKANAGDADAQWLLGLAYADGQGVPQDYAQAAAWYRKAADQGLADAQTNLGVAYYKGEGVPQDFVQAAAWYRKAADQGDADAQYNLGRVWNDLGSCGRLHVG